MKLQIFFTFLIPLLLAVVPGVQNLHKLPLNFRWGVSTSAYQVEGGWNLSGKGPSIWDNFSMYPNTMANNETADVADDVFHRYLEDIQMMASLGIKSSRISIAWSRVLPNGTINSPNPAGVDYYNNVFNAMKQYGIEPFVTLYHWDLPNALNNRTNVSTWLDPNIINLFNDYADFCFQNFGDRVKHWITFNEIQSFAWSGYGDGGAAPGRCSGEASPWCEEIGGGGNSSTEPYIVGHHALLAHAYAVQTYRAKYQKQQNGVIGMTIDSGFGVPYNLSNTEDHEAADNLMIWQYSWFADPLVFGKYPDIMVQWVGDRLPKFTQAESQLLKGSYDYLGLNFYTARYAQWTGIPGQNYSSDNRLNAELYNASGNLIGPATGISWLYEYPQGMRGMLNWIDKRYNHPPIYIFENGVSCPNETNLQPPQVLNDTFRINFLKGYIVSMLEAIVLDGIDVRGYFIWSIIDNFEWNGAFYVKFGLVYVDYANNLTRIIKNSGYFYSNLIKTVSAANGFSLHDIADSYEGDLTDHFDIFE